MRQNHAGTFVPQAPVPGIRAAFCRRRGLWRFCRVSTGIAGEDWQRFLAAAIAETRLTAGLGEASAQRRALKGTIMRAFSLFSSAAGLALVIAATPARAECVTLGFEVNDYGKEGPTKDALSLLDRHIAEAMAKRGIKKYRVGKKKVNCELFLDFIVFDEHTCKAEAAVCWGRDAGKARKK
jgi:hypothetical protein